MNEQPHSDRLEAPRESHINTNKLVIGSLITTVILAFGYISLSMGSESGSRQQDSFQPRLHTETNVFKMPVFKKPEPIVAAKIETLPEPAPPIKEDQPVLPLSLPKIEPVEPLQVVAKTAPTINPDLARRLGGSISGGNDLGLNNSITAPQINKTSERLSEAEFSSLSFNKQKDTKNKEGNRGSIRNKNDKTSRAGGNRVSHEKLFPRALQYQAQTTPKKDRSAIDLSSSVTHASIASRLDQLQFLIKKGTFINCVLTTQVQSDQAGFIKCTVTEDIYSADHTRVLIDRGSEILGEYKPESLTVGKARLHAVWDEVTTPTGMRVSLRSPSVGRLGATGLTGDIDNHWGQRLGVPILLSLFRRNVDYQLERHSRHQGVDYTESGDIASQRIETHYQQYEKIRPTLRKNAGATIGIILARDVSFAAVYEAMQP